MQLQLIADPESPTVSRYAGARSNGANPYSEVVSQVHQEHPAVSPWYAVPGIDDINFDEDATEEHKAEVTAKATKKALTLIKRHAKTLGPTGRRVITGKHTTTGQTVWALAGPLPAGKATTQTKQGSTTDVTALPTEAQRATQKARASSR